MAKMIDGSLSLYLYTLKGKKGATINHTSLPCGVHKERQRDGWSWL
jgi:hypothetical protein